MNQTDLAGALELAMAREEATVAFHDELAVMASFAAQKSTLREFRLMEEGHVTMVKSKQAKGKGKPVTRGLSGSWPSPPPGSRSKAGRLERGFRPHKIESLESESVDACRG